MDYFKTVAMESLENRTLFFVTVTAPPPPPTPTIARDLQQIQADAAQKNLDRSNSRQTILADRIQLIHDKITKHTSVAPLVATLRADVSAGRLALLQDRLAELDTRRVDRNAIISDKVKLLVDRADPVAEAVDQAQLTADQNTLAADVAAARVKFNTDRSISKGQMLDDRAAIVTARIADSPAVTADKLKLLTDQSAAKTTLFNDRAQLLSDRLTLIQDRIAKR